VDDISPEAYWNDLIARTSAFEQCIIPNRSCDQRPAIHERTAGVRKRAGGAGFVGLMGAAPAATQNRCAKRAASEFLNSLPRT